MHPALEQVDWPEIDREALADFQTLLRFDTTNPPGNERACALWIAEQLRNIGLDPVVLESQPDRANVVVRLCAGTNDLAIEQSHGDGAKRCGGLRRGPLLISSHIDVVPADPAHWDHPPFAAEIHDGVLYGRGAIDMKHMTAMCLTAMRVITRLGIPLKRDLIMVACADEETGSVLGSRWLTEHHPELVTADYVFNEVGGFTLHFAGRRLYPIQVAEKGICWCTVTCEGEPGHGSIPAPDAALPRLAHAAALIATHRLPHHNTAVMQRVLGDLSHNAPMLVGLVLPLLRVPMLAPLILKLFPDTRLARTFDAYLRNTANPTMFHAGTKVNVVPGRAELQVDGRLLPGQSADDFVRELSQLIGPGFTIRVDMTHLGIATDDDDGRDPVLGVIRDVIEEHDPGAKVISSMTPGYTDNHAYTALGARCFGFAPVKMEPGLNFAGLYHNHNERIGVEGFLWGVKTFVDAVVRVCL